MSLKTWLRSWWGEDMTPAISQEEAIARARRYAEEHGHPFYPPRNVHLERWPVDTGNANVGPRLVWSMALGTRRPMPFVEVDAVDGSVVAWRQGPR